ncbi:MmcQ/YjbR family DNA-binding protein [Demequina globuliformis]|uniref:MmcQ/YjbR family DNA-binding protein n=1 Tax=Demequina globuliformis TaxID=676202 RepID=UPI0007842778|nr:MmcQ/YjbR family DNA-binding protein [Demequina globuliformis]
MPDAKPADVPTAPTWIVDAVLALPGASIVPYPEWGAQTFQVAGKHFGRYGMLANGAPALTVKGDPEENVALREQYASVTPGHYANKRLWISIALEGDCPRAIALECVSAAYEIVRASLPKRVQAELG